MVRVAIVDDHPVTRHGLQSMLDSAPDVDVVACTDTPSDALSTDGTPMADVVVLDLYLTGDQPSLEWITRLAARTPVLVMSASRTPVDVLAAIQSGASGYVTKHASDDVYLAAIRAVVTGEFYLSDQLADLIQAALAGLPNGARRPQLSPQERQTLMYIARGFTHQQTATRMSVSKSTVDTYIGRIRAKLQLGNKAELTLAALQYLDPPATGEV